MSNQHKLNKISKELGIPYSDWIIRNSPQHPEFDNIYTSFIDISNSIAICDKDVEYNSDKTLVNFIRRRYIEAYQDIRDFAQTQIERLEDGKADTKNPEGS